MTEIRGTSQTGETVNFQCSSNLDLTHSSMLLYPSEIFLLILPHSKNLGNGRGQIEMQYDFEDDIHLHHQDHKQLNPVFQISSNFFCIFLLLNQLNEKLVQIFHQTWTVSNSKTKVR